MRSQRSVSVPRAVVHPLSQARHNATLRELRAQYDGSAIDVSVRQLVGPLPADDHTHSIYPYPARLVRQIPRLFLDATEVIPQEATVIDPFCGSGTVLVEAQQSGRRSIGMDSNPIAALVASAKTAPIDAQDLQSVSDSVRKRAMRSRTFYQPPNYLKKWYSDGAYSALSRLATAIAELDPSPETDAQKLALALTARETSLADPRVPVPVRRRAHVGSSAAADVWEAFQANSARLRLRLDRVSANAPSADVRNRDSRTEAAWHGIDSTSPAVVVTSPPYGAAQKYVRSTSLEAGWLGMIPPEGPIALERLSVGREHLTRDELKVAARASSDPALERFLSGVEAVNPTRAAVYARYFADIANVFQTGFSPRGIETVVLVCGTNVVAGHHLETHRHLADLIISQGFEETLVLRDRIRGRTLMTTRNGTAKPAQSEYIYVLERKRNDP